MRRMMRWLVILFAAVMAAQAIGAWFPGWVGPSYTPRPDPRPGVTVGLVQGPIHTDFVLPLTPETRADFAFLDLADGARFLLVGWGAHGFYTTTGSYRDLSAASILRAVTGDSAVLRFQPLGDAPPMIPVYLDARTYDALRAGIIGQIAAPAPLMRDRLGPGDAFYAAEGRFNLINNCNTWAGRMLNRSGKSFGIWTPSTWAVRLSARYHLPD